MINTGMSKDDSNTHKDNTENHPSASNNMEKAMFRVSDHVVIKETKTGKVIINKRG